MKLLGLTGGIGSGKSTVASIFRELGAHVIDADEVAREVVQAGEPALQAIREVFGADVLDAQGHLDRGAMASRVFNDPEALARLNAIVHPAVAQRTRERIEASRRRGDPWVVYDVPLLYENGLEGMFDAVVVVTASEEVRRARLLEREEWSREDIDARIRAQMPLDEKAHRADWVVDNDGSLLETRRQAEQIVTELFGSDP